MVGKILLPCMLRVSVANCLPHHLTQIAAPHFAAFIQVAAFGPAAQTVKDLLQHHQRVFGKIQRRVHGLRRCHCSIGIGFRHGCDRRVGFHRLQVYRIAVRQVMVADKPASRKMLTSPCP
jgi:hypothetical protein